MQDYETYIRRKIREDPVTYDLRKLIGQLLGCWCINDGLVVDIHKINGKRPKYDVYIGRAVRFTEFTTNSIWANPFYPSNYIVPSIEKCHGQILRKLILEFGYETGGAGLA